jgi:hypothetical protein
MRASFARSPGSIGVVLAIAFLTPRALLAATLEPKVLGQLINSAEFIVRGHVKAVRPRPSGEGGPRTLVVVAVEEQWKGAKLSAIRMIQPRGTEGGITQDVPGLPIFRVGEEVILFVVREGPRYYQVVGGRQGKYSVRKDPQTGRRVVEDLTGARLDLPQFIGHLGSASKPLRQQ